MQCAVCNKEMQTLDNSAPDAAYAILHIRICKGCIDAGEKFVGARASRWLEKCKPTPIPHDTEAITKKD